MATRKGFAQVELNHISGNVDGSVYAQYLADTATMGNVLEQGRFAKYDGETLKANLSGKGAWMMIYNEEKLPDPRKQSHKDFALKTVDYTDGEITPRLIEINVGDIFTTNALDADTAFTATTISALTDISETTITIPAVGTTLKINSANGYLSTTGDSDEEFTVIKPFAGNTADMPDGQPAVKLMRTK